MDPRPEPGPKIEDRPRSTESLKAQFRDLAKSVATPPKPQPGPNRRKKEEETRGGGLMSMARRFLRHLLPRQFRQQAEGCCQPVVASILDTLYTLRPYDPKQARAEAEWFLRKQLDEWAREGSQAQPQDGSFSYARRAGFDPQP